MRLMIRVDGDGRIGGGHVMRCLTLAEAARRAGHAVSFVMADGPGSLAGRVRAAGFDVVALPRRPHAAETEPPLAGWLSLPSAEDARLSRDAALAFAPDWLVLDHYGLDIRWVRCLRDALPAVRVLAIDDLDDRPLGADLLLDVTRLDDVGYRHPPMAALRGPGYALLRPDFAAARPVALARRGGPVRRVLVTPGLMDAAGLAPLALTLIAERFPDLAVEVVMGAASQSLAATRALVAAHPRFRLALDATDMARRMTEADLCIGAGGMTNWERCALGLPTLAVAVADNQGPGVAQLAARGAVVGLTLAEARDGDAFAAALGRAIAAATPIGRAAAAICDGDGTGRVLAALSGTLRPLTADDARLLFDWRDQPRIRAVSLNRAPLVWETHRRWVETTAARRDGLWMVYAEAGCPVGFVGAGEDGDGGAIWSFYIGAEDAAPGAGGRMLTAFLRRLCARPGLRRVRAVVLPDNAASIRLHERLGFTPDRDDEAPGEPNAAPAPGGTLAFSLDAWDVRARLGLPDPGSVPPERT
jgi:UDP-2,4-diacetamido-2,4,6-trideoxy-beta-L-altropyranose hydrolase